MVAVAGDIVEVKNNNLYVNNILQSENYINEKPGIQQYIMMDECVFYHDCKHVYKEVVYMHILSYYK